MQINANWLLLSCKGIQKHNVPKYIASLFQSHSKQTDNSFHWMHRSYTKAIHLWKRPGLPEGSVVLIHENYQWGQIPWGEERLLQTIHWCVWLKQIHITNLANPWLFRPPGHTLSWTRGCQQMPSPCCLKRNKGTSVSSVSKIKAKPECKINAVFS